MDNLELNTAFDEDGEVKHLLDIVHGACCEAADRTSQQRTKHSTVPQKIAEHD